MFIGIDFANPTERTNVTAIFSRAQYLLLIQVGMLVRGRAVVPNGTASKDRLIGRGNDHDYLRFLGSCRETRSKLITMKTFYNFPIWLSTP